MERERGDREDTRRLSGVTVVCTFLSMFASVTVTSLAIWAICLFLAAGVAWSRYEKKRTRDKFLRELLAMDPARREKVLSRLRPDMQSDLRQQLMERFRVS